MCIVKLYVSFVNKEHKDDLVKLIDSISFPIFHKEIPYTDK